MGERGRRPSAAAAAEEEVPTGDGVEDGGEEVWVGEARIRRRRWAARVPVPFGTVPTLVGNGLGTGERRGGVKRRWRSFPSA